MPLVVAHVIVGYLVATTGAASLVGELASETRKKVMHDEKP